MGLETQIIGHESTLEKVLYDGGQFADDIQVSVAVYDELRPSIRKIAVIPGLLCTEMMLIRRSSTKPTQKWEAIAIDSIASIQRENFKQR